MSGSNLTELSDQLQALVSKLLGMKVAHPWLGYGSAIFLELGNLHSEKTIRNPKWDACIAISWDWRVERHGSTLFGSDDSAPKMERGLQRLAGLSVQSISMMSDAPELSLMFSDGYRLRTMLMTSGDPEWYIRRIQGDYVYVVDGRLIVSETGAEKSDELEDSDDGSEATLRWGAPRTNDAAGECGSCRWYVRLDGSFYYLDYGVCTHASSVFDGKAVNLRSGCSKFDTRLSSIDYNESTAPKSGS